MAKTVSSFELSLQSRPPQQKLANWLYSELRRAILEGRLSPGSRLPGSRDFASQYGLSRGTVVNAYERLQSEGYVSSRVGLGTRVNRVAVPLPALPTPGTPPAYINRVRAAYVRPKPWADLTLPHGMRPFRMGDPAVTEFPCEVWGRLAAHRAKNFRSWVKSPPDGQGYRPLRQAVADYLSTSRGVRCSADQVFLVSGTQQALDLLARLLLQPHDPVWLEDPAYFGASIAFRNAGAKIIPVPVDDEGLSVATGKRLSPHARGAYLTPAHQFPTGVTMSLSRRMAILHWASRTGAFIIEDDYDSEYRFGGQPVPALQGMDNHSSVILVGSFSKTLLPSLRIGYIVMPPSLVDLFLAFRYQTDFRNASFEQAVLSDFIAEGHLARHMRRMRDLYGGRLAELIDAGKEYLDGLLDISEVRAGLYTLGFLKNTMSSRQAEKAAANRGIEVLDVDRYTLQRPDPRGVILGFASFPEAVIRKGIIQLAKALG